MISSWRFAASQKGLLNSGFKGLGRGLLYSVVILHLPFLQCGLRAKYERAHHAPGAASTIDEDKVIPSDLALPCPPHDLTGRFNNVSKATSATNWLPGRYLTAIGINRKTAFVGSVNRIVKWTYLTFFAKTGIFEAHGREDGISIIHFGKLHILRPIVSHLKRLAGGDGYRCGGEPGTLPDRVVIGNTGPGAE